MKLYIDHFQNYKRYNIPKAQLIIADIPFNLGNWAYANNPAWYKDGDNKNGESELAGKAFFDTDKDFRVAEFMHFVSSMLKKEPREKGQAGCMIAFCEFEQQFMLIEKGKAFNEVICPLVAPINATTKGLYPTLWELTSEGGQDHA